MWQVPRTGQHATGHVEGQVEHVMRRDHRVITHENRLHRHFRRSERSENRKLLPSALRDAAGDGAKLRAVDGEMIRQCRLRFAGTLSPRKVMA